MPPPKKIGKYEVLGQIAIGGFGVIYKGWDPFIKRPVAIKMCASEDAEVRQRFHREAEFVGNLVHRNITLVFDFGIEDEVPYIVQEYLTGFDVDQLLKAGTLTDEATIVAILLQVCEGLDFAHHRSIIHRDIKPSNVRVLEDGTVKLMDFGIAKSMEGGTRLTQTGIALGTAGYLAPEQIQGGRVDPRTDIFALGVLAYELITGIRPFEGKSLSNVLYRVLHDEPKPAREINPACSPGLEEVIVRCLAKDPEQRFQSARELADTLRHVELAEGQWRERTEAILRDAVQRVGGEGGGTGDRRLTARDVNWVPAPTTPQVAVLDHPPAPEEHERRRFNPVLVTFLTLLVVLIGAAGTVYLSTGIQGWLFPGGAPWVPTPTPTPTPRPTATPTPSPTPTARPTVAPTPQGPVTVRLVVDPPAELSIDGAPYGSGKVQGGTARLLPGQHTFTLTLPDYPVRTLTRTVTPETRTISLALDIGLLTITLDPMAPPGGVAFLDGTRLGPVPLINHKVPTGPHDLAVRWEAGEPYRERITVLPSPNPPVVRVVAPPGTPLR